MPPTKLEEVRELQENRDRLLDELKLNLQTAQQRMKYYADKHRREVQFKVGNWVFLRLQPYRLRPLAAKRNEKL